MVCPFPNLHLSLGPTVIVSFVTTVTATKDGKSKPRKFYKNTQLASPYESWDQAIFPVTSISVGEAIGNMAFLTCSAICFITDFVMLQTTSVFK